MYIIIIFIFLYTLKYWNINPVLLKLLITVIVKVESEI